MFDVSFGDFLMFKYFLHLFEHNVCVFEKTGMNHIVSLFLCVWCLLYLFCSGAFGR